MLVFITMFIISLDEASLFPFYHFLWNIIFGIAAVEEFWTQNIINISL